MADAMAHRGSDAETDAATSGHDQLDRIGPIA
jgi:hypothetical protein